jgi:hypothetical protein
MYRSFCTLLRDAIFVNCDDDLGHAQAVLSNRADSADISSVSKRHFIRKGRARRKIPEVSYKMSTVLARTHD